MMVQRRIMARVVGTQVLYIGLNTLVRSRSYEVPGASCIASGAEGAGRR